MDVFPGIKYPELFFGFVAPIGVHSADYVQEFTRLLRSLGYRVVLLKRTTAFTKLEQYLNFETKLEDSPLEKRFQTFIQLATTCVSTSLSKLLLR